MNKEKEFADIKKKLINHLVVCKNFYECDIKIEHDLFSWVYQFVTECIFSFFFTLNFLYHFIPSENQF